MHRQFPPARRRRLRLATAIAGVAGLALGVAVSGAGYPAAAGTAAASSPAQPSVVSATAPNVRTVTLPTGDKIMLTTNGKHVAATAEPAPGHDPDIQVDAMTRPDGTTSDITAMPADASQLVLTGLVDRNLFDVSWLEAHGDIGAAGTITVSIGYGSGVSAAVARGSATALPGASVVSAAGNTVRVSVSARSAAAFWAALTGHAGVDAGKPAWSLRPRLTGGAVKVWATGHASTPTAAPADASQPLYTVTVHLKRTSAALTSCGGAYATLCLNAGGDMLQVSPAVTRYDFNGVQCATSAPCTDWVATFSVPAGVYDLTMPAYALTDNTNSEFWMVDPQVTVAGDTTVTFDADKADPVTTSTPRGSWCLACMPESVRTAPDGTGYTSISSGGGPYSTLTVAPTSVPVTIGSYHFSVIDQVGTAPVSMTVNAPRQLPLRVEYRGAPWIPENEITPFSGTQSLEVVDAGHGDASDFAKVDAKGKLVLLHPNEPITFNLTEQEFQNAKDAGAAGVLVDRYPGQVLLTPVPWLCDCPQYPPVHIPVVGLARADAETLDSLLASGPVKVTVTENGVSPYLYDFVHTYERVPAAPLHDTVTDADLVHVPTTYHGAGPDLVQVEADSFAPAESFTIATSYAVPAGTTIDHFYGPPTPDRVWQTWTKTWEPTADSIKEENYASQVLTAGSHPEQWLAAPYAVPGPNTPATDVLAAQPGKWDINAPALDSICSFCRGGDNFYPITNFTSGADPALTSDLYTYQVDSMHMYGPDGTEIPLTHSVPWSYYVLPDALGRYRFTTSGGGVDSAWTFASERPARNDAPSGYTCLNVWPLGGTDPCHADPLIFLRYNGFTAADNSVTASASHKLEITPVYQQDPGGTAPLSSITVWTSTDGGTTWTKAVTHRDPDGGYTAMYRVPATTGSVAVKVQASDPQGDTVAQTLHDAFAISG